MKLKFLDILIGLTFIFLIIGAAIMQTGLKNEPQIEMILFGFITLASLFIKQPNNTSILLYILLAMLIYINTFIVTNFIVNIINPDDGWFVDNTGRHRVMSLNWIWGVVAGIIISPLMVIIYHKFVKRNRLLEILLTIFFIITTIIIYIIYEIL